MALKYKFEIDQETCFVYWLQTMAGKWSWFFQNHLHDFFYENSENFNEKEKASLESFRKFLQVKEPYKKEYEAENWLWNLYAGKQLVKKEEVLFFSGLQERLRIKFQDIWNKEKPKLEYWQTILNGYNFKAIEKPMVAALNFIGGVLPTKEIKVKLVFASPAGPLGRVHRHHKNLILLGISNVAPEESERVVGTLLHETLHLADHYKRGIVIILKKEFLKKLFTAYLLKIKRINITKGYKWDFLLNESVLRSVVSSKFNTFIGEKLPHTPEQLSKDVDFNLISELHKKSPQFLIRIVAMNLLGEIKNYIAQEKQLDKKFGKKVAEEWLRVANIIWKETHP